MAAVKVVLGFSVLMLVGLPWRVTSSQQVPVLLWSSESSLWTKGLSTHGGHVTTDRQLGEYLDSALKSGPRNVLLFLQDKLSVEDFTAFGGVYGNKQDSAFPNLESIMGSSPSSLVLPSVDWYAANILPTYLKEKLGVSPLHVDQSTLLELRLNETIPSLLVVRLPYASSNGVMRCKDVLRANDEVIGQVLSTLKSEGVPYTALLTALRPSRVGAEPEFGVANLRRQLLATDLDYPPVSYNSTTNVPCILFWAQNISVRFDQTVIDLTHRTFANREAQFTGSICTNTNAILALTYPNGIKVSFHMSSRYYKVSGRQWATLNHIEVHNGTHSANFLASQASTPKEYSYRCQFASSLPAFGSILINNSSRDSPTAKWNLHMHEFQIQGFNVSTLRFSYASDCAGFFSPGIWMGLVTTLLFVFILTYGLHMVMSLKTMDRFDDPKGPSISVPQTE